MSSDTPYQVTFYTTRRGQSLLDEFLDELPESHLGKVYRWIRLLEQYGPNLPRPYADVLDGPIRELRVRYGHNQYRFFYFFHGKAIIMTHGIMKKTGSVPVGNIEQAKRYRQDWIERDAPEV